MGKEVVCMYVYKSMYMYIDIYNGILLGHKKEWIWVSCSETDEPRACYTVWSHKKKNKYRILMHVCGI